MHLVCRKGKYWSLEESYREGKKVKKRRLAYYGTRKPADPQARMEQMLDTAERKAGEWDEFQRKEFGETGAERAERLREEAKFSPHTFLEETTQSSQEEAATASMPPEASEPDGSPASEPSQDASDDSAPSEPDAEPSSEG